MRDALARGLRAFHGPIARGATGSLAVRLSFLGSSFVQSVLLARLAGPEGYGIFAILHAVSMLAARVCVFGLDRVALKEIASARVNGDWSRVRAVTETTQRLALVIALLGAILMLATGLLLGSYGAVPLIAVAALTVILTLLTLLQGTSQGLGAIVLAQLPSNLIRSLLFVLLLAAVAMRTGSLSGGMALMLNALASGASLLLAYWMLRGQLPDARIQTRPEPARHLLADGLPFTVSAVLVYLNTELVTLVIGAVSTTDQAGLFQPVARLSNVMATGQLALSMPLAPRIAELWTSGNTAAIEALARRSARAAFMVTVGIAVPVAVGARVILAAFGPEFLQVETSLYVVAAAHVIAASLGPAVTILAMTGHAHASLTGPLLSILVILTITPVLIEPLGVLGGSIAMGVGLVVSRSSVLVLARRHLGIRTSI